MEIEEVEMYLKNEKHLPWVTSAKSENTNGINMTRMGFETLEALENLQMQNIALNDKIKAQQEQIDKLVKLLEQ